MPIFEYQCPDCTEKFEKIVFRQDASVECPKCGAPNPRKLLSSFAVAVDSPRKNPEPGPCPCGAAERGMCQMGMK